VLQVVPSQFRNGLLSAPDACSTLFGTTNQRAWYTHGWQRYDERADADKDALHDIIVRPCHSNVNGYAGSTPLPKRSGDHIVEPHVMSWRHRAPEVEWSSKQP